jgi:hypothetical protein
MGKLILPQSNNTASRRKECGQWVRRRGIGKETRQVFSWGPVANRQIYSQPKLQLPCPVVAYANGNRLGSTTSPTGMPRMGPWTKSRLTELHCDSHATCPSTQSRRLYRVHATVRIGPFSRGRHSEQGTRDWGPPRTGSIQALRRQDGDGSRLTCHRGSAPVAHEDPLGFRETKHVAHVPSDAADSTARQIDIRRGEIRRAIV